MISRKTICSYALMVLFAFRLVPAASAQAPLQITSPTQGTSFPLFQEGQTYTITLSANSSVSNVAVFTQWPLPDPQPTAIPLQFTLTLPTNITPGIYSIGAMGFTSGSDVEAAPVFVDVERPDAPVSISVIPLNSNLPGIGSQLPIQVSGTYADGTNLFLANSTQTVLVSNNNAIATVSGASSSSPASSGAAIATVTAAGVGETSIVVSTYASGVATPSASETIWVTVQPALGPAPVITNISPGTGTPGVTQVTVNGSNFGSSQGSGYVELGNMSATTISEWTTNQIVAIVPLGSMPGVAEVKQNGLASNDLPFATVVPSITGVNPATGSTGTPITITGTNFGTSQGSSSVMFNRGAASPTSWSTNSIVTPVPAGATTGNLIVFVNGVPSNPVSFTATPSIANLSPTSGNIEIPVTITGTNFGAVQGTSTVTFNGTPATPTSWSLGSIVVPVPIGATPGPVVVTVNGISSNGPTFNVLLSASPIDLTATSVGQTEIYLSWVPSATPGVTYSISRGTTPSSLTPLQGASGFSGNSYYDGSVVPATTYYYVVYAVNANGPSLPSNEASAAYGAISSIAAKFNSAPISSSSYIWFTSVLTPAGLGGSPVTVYVRNSTITFSAAGTNYIVPGPDANLVFTPGLTTTTAVFNAPNLWVITAPTAGLSGNTLLDALAFQPPTGLPGNLKAVNWSASFSSATPGVTLQWKWTAAVYSSLNTNYDLLGVKPISGRKGSQYADAARAGTPESFESFLVPGAMSAGGTNYTGSYCQPQQLPKTIGGSRSRSGAERPEGNDISERDRDEWERLARHGKDDPNTVNPEPDWVTASCPFTVTPALISSCVVGDSVRAECS